LSKTDALISWEEIGDVKTGRPNLGQEVPVNIYRLMQYSIRHVLSMEFNKELADQILFKAGKLVGEKFCRDYLDTNLELPDFLTQLKNVLLEQKIGILRVEKADTEKMELILTVAEDLDCSGLPLTNSTVCSYDEGFIAGILKVYTGKEFTVKEIDCWGTGDRVCRFRIFNPV